jgi:NAD(P)-dependent dehydrogenase (short-subunit alcohol dehydrogenase family)
VRVAASITPANAGIIALGTIVDCTEAEWDRVIDVNHRGVWRCLKYEIPQMVAQGGGAIVNTASIAGIKSTAGAAAYSARKHGVISLTKSATRQYASARVNAVCPGSLETPMTDFIFAEDLGSKEQAIAGYPTGRFGTPDEIAAVLWLCSDAASFVTGHPLVADSGRLL